VRRGTGAWLLVILVAGGLAIFVAAPILAVLVASFETPRRLERGELVALTATMLEQVPEAERERRLNGWWQRARTNERIDTRRAALELAGESVTARSDDRYDIQARAIDAALGRLTPERRTEIEARMPLVNAALHKRVLIADGLEHAVPAAELAAFRLGQSTTMGIANYARLAFDGRLRAALLNGVLLATTSAALVTALAFALAYAIQRARVPGAQVIRAVALLPLVSPPVLVAFALLLLFGRQGLVTFGLLDQTLGLVDANSFNIYGFGGIVVAQVIGLLPPAYVVIDNALARQDGALEEAAVSGGASFADVLRHVTLPMAAPALARAFILSFVLSMTDFGNPEVVGQGYPVLAGEIYDMIVGTREFPLAAAACLSLLGPGLALYLLAERVFDRRRYDPGQRVAAATGHVVPPAIRGALLGLGIATAAIVAILFLVVVASAFTVYWGVDHRFTLAHFLGVRADLQDQTFAQSGFGTRYLGLSSVWTSLQVAALAAPIGGLFALLTVYVLDRLRPPGRSVLSFVALLPAVFPGIVFGIGYLHVFNAPFGVPALALTGTIAILVLNILFGNLFVGILAGRGVLQKTAAGIEDAAATLGASEWQSFRHVVLPLMRQAFILGALFIFIDAMTTLSAVIFLVTGEHMLASVLIFSQATGVEYGSAAAKSTTILAIVLATVAVAFLVERRLNRMLRQ
jgi:iron(III) transport system permease protein